MAKLSTVAGVASAAAAAAQLPSEPFRAHI